MSELQEKVAETIRQGVYNSNVTNETIADAVFTLVIDEAEGHFVNEMRKAGIDTIRILEIASAVHRTLLQERP